MEDGLCSAPSPIGARSEGKKRQTPVGGLQELFKINVFIPDRGRQCRLESALPICRFLSLSRGSDQERQREKEEGKGESGIKALHSLNFCNPPTEAYKKASLWA